METLFVDLDGVLSNFYQGFKDQYEVSLNNLSDERLRYFKRRFAEDHFYRDLPIYEGAVEFIDHLRQLGKVEILTAAGDDHFAMNAADKRLWVEKYFGSEMMVHTVPKSHHKAIFSAVGILIDDRAKSVEPFRERGGIAFQFNGDYQQIQNEVRMFLNA